MHVEGEQFYTATADFGLSLRNDEPGDRSVCMCREGFPDNVTYQIATLTLMGPSTGNTASCFKSDTLCRFDLRGVGLTAGDHVRIMTSCEEVSLTPPGFVQGAVATADDDGFFEMDTSLMRREDLGLQRTKFEEI